MYIRHITDERFKQYKAEVDKFENDMKMVSDTHPSGQTGIKRSFLTKLSS